VDIILDETTLAPCQVLSVEERITNLVRLLIGLDQLGAERVLRAVEDAASRDISNGFGLKDWCFKIANRDAGRFLSTRLTRQPFVDGKDGLFERAEGTRSVEGRINFNPALGATLSALTNDCLVLLGSAQLRCASPREVDIDTLDEGGEMLRQRHTIVGLVCEADLTDTKKSELRYKVWSRIENGTALLARAIEVFPRLVMGETAILQLHEFNRSSDHLKQILRHLDALNRAAIAWQTGEQYAVTGISASPESLATLNHGKLGELRDFHTPNGFAHQRWSWHSKITGTPVLRLYFRGVRTEIEGKVLIGYIGPHLPTAREK